MYKKINKNKLGVIEYSIDTEEDLNNIKIDNIDNTVYATMNNNGKELIYLTVAEYEALSEEEKGRDGVVYNIITNDML